MGMHRGLTAKGQKTNLGSAGNVLKYDYGDTWTTPEIQFKKIAELQAYNG